MSASLLLLAAAFEILPFWQQKPGYAALRPVWSREGETTDVLWPLFTSRRDWWRAGFLAHAREDAQGGSQFSLFPLWWHGRERADGGKEGAFYWGLWPLWGRHPHVLMLTDWRFCLWPLWMRYKTPRPAENRFMTTDAVLFPFAHWRDDGSWGLWPLCGFSRNRADDAWYALWPVWNAATFRPDRDTAGPGSSWMLWPLLGRVDRAREDQWLFLPPLFSRARTPDGWRLRCPYPFVEIERTAARDRTSVFPFWERVAPKAFRTRQPEDETTRFGWRLVELLPDETRVFPFWTSRKDGSYFRLWPLWESWRTCGGDLENARCLALFPIRWADGVDRNWAKFWTFYERETDPAGARHSLFWSLIRWRTDRW